MNQTSDTPRTSNFTFGASYQLHNNMSQPVIFILGAGPGIGQSVADGFSAKGYKVALAARSIENGPDKNGYYGVKLDMSEPANIAGAFATVTKEVGIPSVVVYNGDLHL